MTTAERIGRVEEKQDNMTAQVTNLDTKIDRNFAESQRFHEEILAKLGNLDERYPTRREFKSANYVFGTVISLLALAIALYANVIKVR